MGSIIVIIFLFFQLNKSKQPEKFKGIELDEITKKDFTKTIRANGTGDNRILKKGFIKLGKLNKIGKITVKKDKQNHTYYCLEVYPLSGFGRLFAHLFGLFINRFYMSGENLKFFKDEVQIEETIRIVPFAGIFTDSEVGIEEVDTIAWKHLKKDTLEELANLPKRVVFLDTRASKTATLLEEASRLEKEKWRARTEDILSGK